MKILHNGITLSCMFFALMLIIGSLFVSTNGHAIGNNNYTSNNNMDEFIHTDNETRGVETYTKNKADTLIITDETTDEKAQVYVTRKGKIAEATEINNPSTIQTNRKRVKRSNIIDSNTLKHVLKSEEISKASVEARLKNEFDKQTENVKLGWPCQWWSPWNPLDIDCVKMRKGNSCLDLYNDIETRFKDIKIKNWRNAKELWLFPDYDTELHKRIKGLNQKEVLEYFLRKLVWCGNFYNDESDPKEVNDKFIKALLLKYKAILWQEDPCTATNNHIDYFLHQEFAEKLAKERQNN